MLLAELRRFLRVATAIKWPCYFTQFAEVDPMMQPELVKAHAVLDKKVIQKLLVRALTMISSSEPSTEEKEAVKHCAYEIAYMYSHLQYLLDNTDKDAHLCKDVNLDKISGFEELNSSRFHYSEEEIVKAVESGEITSDSDSDEEEGVEEEGVGDEVEGDEVEGAGDDKDQTIEERAAAIVAEVLAGDKETIADRLREAIVKLLEEGDAEEEEDSSEEEDSDEEEEDCCSSTCGTCVAEAAALYDPIWSHVAMRSGSEEYIEVNKLIAKHFKKCIGIEALVKDVTGIDC